MADAYLRQSPLDHLGLPARAVADPGAAGVLACERRFLTKLNLRGDAAGPAFQGAVKPALGFVPPAQPNTVDGKRDRYALWLGPDEWLVVAPPGAETKLLKALRAALAEARGAVTDVSEGRTVLRVAGTRARDVLAKGCPVDLHPRAFGPGRCAQTRMAKALVIVHQLDEGPTFDLFVERSFSDYLWHWLEDAALEYGFAVVAEPPAEPKAKRR